MRLIDADALIEILAAMQGRCDTKAALVHNSKIWNQVKDMPTIDAVPVRHGRWTADESTYTDGEAQCSVCKTTFYVDDLYCVGEKAQSELPNYCPHCGAKMDAERKEE